MALNLYKTTIATPDEKGRIIAVDSENACGVVFKPHTTSLEKIHVFVKFSGTDTVRYTAAIFTLDGDGAPNVSAIAESDMESGLAMATVDISPVGSGAHSQWITFDFSATLATTNNHALVIISDLDTNDGFNGVYYRELTQETADIAGAYTFSASRGTWSLRQELGHSISPCVMYLGGTYDSSTSPIDLGTTQTSGQSGHRGYPMWLCAVNDGSTSSGRVSLYQASDGTGTTQDTYAKETYHGSFPWLRLAPGELPLSSSTLNISLVDAYEYPSDSLAPGQFLLFYQKDRSYALPQIYMREESGPTEDIGIHDGSANGLDYIYISRDTVVSGALERNLVESASASNADLTIYNDATNQRQSTLKNNTGFDSAVVADTYIVNSSDTHPDNAFRIVEIVNDKEIRLNGRRVHPDPEWKVSQVQVGQNAKAIVDHRELSSLYARGFEDFPLVPSSRCRFYESKYDSVDGYLAWSKIFAISAHSGNDYDSLPDKASESQVPYLCATSVTGHTSGKGTYLNCPAISIYSGRSTRNEMSYVVPELADKEALYNLGLTNTNENLYGNVPNAQGLVYIQHCALNGSNKHAMEAFVVRYISDLGIVLDSRLVCAVHVKAGAITGAGTASLSIPIEEFNLPSGFVSTPYIVGGATPLHIIPNPFGNEFLASGSIGASMPITAITPGTGTTLVVDDTSSKFATLCSPLLPASDDIPIYIVYRPALEGTSSSRQVYGYTQYSPDASPMDFIKDGSDYEFGELASDSAGGQTVTTYDYSDAATSAYSYVDTNVGTLVISFVSDADEDDPNHKNYFYSAHNERQLHEFIDRLPGDIQIVFEAVNPGGELTSYIGSANFVSTSNKAIVNTRISNIFTAIRDGAVADNDYETLATQMDADYTAIGAAETDWAGIIFGSGNGSAVAATVATTLADFNTVGFVQIHPGSTTSLFTDIASAVTSGGGTGLVTTCTNTGNLADHAMSVLVPANVAVPNTLVKDFSLVVPLFKDDHNEVWTEVKSSLTGLSNSTFVPVADTPVNYEAIQMPHNEWLDSDTNYAIVKPFEGPINPENITASQDSTLFTFDIDGTGQGNRNCLVWNRELSGIATIDGLNRIFFLYKLNPTSSSSTITGKINCVIQLSPEKTFADALTVYNGTLQTASSSSTSTSSTTSVTTTANTHALPDGYYAFSLDLSQGYGDGATNMWVRMYMEPASDSEGVKSVNVRSLKAYSVGLTNSNASRCIVMAGNVESPAGICADAVTGGAGTCVFSKNGEYVMVDLGAERFVSGITFTVGSYGGNGDTLEVYYKSFIKNKQSQQSEKLLKQFVLSEEITSSPLEINQRFYARFITFKVNTASTFALANVAIDFVSSDMESLYGSGTKTFYARNTDLIYSDENIDAAPRNRVAMFDNTRSTVGMAYSTAAYINQISFNSATEKRTLFRVQYLPAATVLPVTDNTSTSGWVDLGSGYYQAQKYERTATFQASFAGSDGSALLAVGLSTSLTSNNGLSGYVLRISGRDEIFVPVVSSSTVEIGFAQDLRDLGIIEGDECYLEKPNLISFPATQVKAVQIMQISGGNTKVNSLKMFTPLMDSDGAPVAPTLGADALSWNIILTY